MCRLNTLRMQLHLLSFLILQVAVDAFRTYEEAKQIRENLINLMLKPLPKDGKIRLVGGENEYEGKILYLFDRHSLVDLTLFIPSSPPSKGMSKYFTTENGDQFVMMNGIEMMESLRVNSSVTRGWSK